MYDIPPTGCIMCHVVLASHSTPFKHPLWHSSYRMHHVSYNKKFSGRQPCQGVKIFQCFRDRVSPWNGEFLHIDVAVCPEWFYWILSPWKFQYIYYISYCNNCYKHWYSKDESQWALPNQRQKINAHYFRTNTQYFPWKYLIRPLVVLRLESISDIRRALLITLVQSLIGIRQLYLRTATQ